MYCELTSKGKWPQSMPQAFNFWKVEPVYYYIYAWPIRKNYKESTPAEHIIIYSCKTCLNGIFTQSAMALHFYRIMLNMLHNALRKIATLFL